MSIAGSFWDAEPADVSTHRTVIRRTRLIEIEFRFDERMKTDFASALVSRLQWRNRFTQKTSPMIDHRATSVGTEQYACGPQLHRMLLAERFGTGNVRDRPKLMVEHFQAARRSDRKQLCFRVDD